MKTIIIIYLLAKSVFNRTFTHFDIRLAKAPDEPPSYVAMVANLNEEAKLPEVWADFLWEASGWVDRLLGDQEC